MIDINYLWWITLINTNLAGSRTVVIGFRLMLQMILRRCWLEFIILAIFVDFWLRLLALFELIDFGLRSQLTVFLI